MTPFLDGKPLTQRPIEPAGSRSGMYFAAGKHRLRVELSEGRVRSIVVKVPSKGQLTIVCFHTLNSQTQTLQTRLFSLSDKTEPVEKGYQPLRVKSLSRREVKIDLGFEQLFIDPMGDSFSYKWRGQALSPTYEGCVIGNLVSQGEGGHTILLWDGIGEKLMAVMIDHIEPTLPKGLRKDLTFGPSRKELPYLKKMN